MTPPCSGAQLCCPARTHHPLRPGPTLTAPHSPYTKARPRAPPPTRPVLLVWHLGKGQTAGLEGPGAHPDPLVSGWATLDRLSSVLDPRAPRGGPQRLRLREEPRIWHESFEALVLSSATRFPCADGGTRLSAPGTSPPAPQPGLPLTGFTQDVCPAGQGSPLLTGPCSWPTSTLPAPSELHFQLL